ncbi:hypothetical protein CW713_08655, partial [Methanophagales archaeon]
KEILSLLLIYLLNRGSLDFMHDLPESDWRLKGAIIIAILVKLDYIDYETRPRRLFKEIS